MLSCKRGKFSLPVNETYLNCAYMSPIMHSVEKAGIRGIRRKRNPSQILPGEFFDEGQMLRKEFATLINAPTEDSIVIIPSVSYGIATVAKNINLQPGQNIIVAAEQFPSNFYAWSDVCAERHANLKVVAPPKELTDRGKVWNERILEAIDSNTRLVALGHVHWTDGTKFDLLRIRARTKDVNALLVIDGTQSVGALPFDVATIRPDALICAGYKWLLGPYSIGLAYFSDFFSDGKPLEENWINRLQSEDFKNLVNYQSQYQPGALRYEVGEHSNFILVPMMLKALQQINRWHPNNIQDYCEAITKEALLELQDHGYFVEDQQFRSHHLFGIRVPHSANVEELRNELLKRKIIVSYRGDAIRVSPNVYNRESDMQKFVKVLTRKL